MCVCLSLWMSWWFFSFVQSPRLEVCSNHKIRSWKKKKKHRTWFLNVSIRLGFAVWFWGEWISFSCLVGFNASSSLARISRTEHWFMLEYATEASSIYAIDITYSGLMCFYIYMMWPLCGPKKKGEEKRGGNGWKFRVMFNDVLRHFGADICDSVNGFYGGERPWILENAACAQCDKSLMVWIFQKRRANDGYSIDESADDDGLMFLDECRADTSASQSVSGI